MKRRTIFVSIVIVLILAGAAVSTAAIVKYDHREKTYNNYQWTNLNLVENIYPNYQRVTANDNFYGYAWEDNFLDPRVKGAEDIEKALKALKDMSLDGKTEDKTNEMIRNIFAKEGGATIYSGSDADVMYKYYEMNEDMAARDAAGFSPIEESVKEIWAIDSLEKLSEYMKTGGKSHIAGTFLSHDITTNYKDGTKTSVYLYAFGYGFDSEDNFSDSLYEEQMALFDLMIKHPVILGYLGITAEEAATYKGVLKNFEKSMVEEIKTEGQHVELSKEGLAQQRFPFTSDEKKYIDKGCDSFVIDSVQLKALNERWDESNILCFKIRMLNDLFNFASLHLDSVAYEIYNQANKDKDGHVYTKEDTLIEDTSNDFASLLAAQFYSKEMDLKYPTMKAEITELSKQVLKAGGEYFQGLSWLSDESKRMMKEKCDSMNLYIFHPDTWDAWSFSAIDLSSVTSFYDLCVKINTVYQDIYANCSVCAPGTYWSVDSLPQMDNAFYAAADNAFTMGYAYTAAFYFEEKEKLYAVVGHTVAHEMCHGFDDTGCDYDKNGAENPVLTKEDRKKFNDRTNELIKYMSGFKLGVKDDKGNDIYLNGKESTGEVIADMGGLAIILHLAKDSAGFDYDLFFKTYAHGFDQFILSKKFKEEWLDDPHPVGTYRVNAVVQQFAEFYETYNIVEGDGMYLSMNDRVNVWA